MWIFPNSDRADDQEVLWKQKKSARIMQCLLVMQSTDTLQINLQDELPV
jgi:hypothetical protein